MPAQAQAHHESIQRKERLEPQTKWGKYPKEPPLRCHRHGARLHGATPEPALDAEQTPEGRSTPSPATSSSTNSESSAKNTHRKERKNRRKCTRAAESDSEDIGFRDVMKKLSGEDDALSRAIEGMQTAQAQQNQLMTQLLGSFNRYMDAKTLKKE